MALANVGGSNEHPRKLRRDPLSTATTDGGVALQWRRSAWFIHPLGGASHSAQQQLATAVCGLMFDVDCQSGCTPNKGRPRGALVGFRGPCRCGHGRGVGVGGAGGLW
jgi:hypothetical protein